MNRLEELIKELPPDLQQEVQDFAQFLVEKHTKKYDPTLRQDWVGMLKNLRDQYASVELQHKISEWRIAKKEDSPPTETMR